jgi:hypothetical protein
MCAATSCGSLTREAGLTTRRSTASRLEVTTQGSADLIEGEGGGTGYMTFTAENGDRLYSQARFVAQRVGGKPFVTWVSRISGGTGKLAGLRGTAKLMTNFDPTAGGQISNSTVEVELAK